MHIFTLFGIGALTCARAHAAITFAFNSIQIANEWIPFLDCIKCSFFGLFHFIVFFFFAHKIVFNCNFSLMLSIMKFCNDLLSICLYKTTSIFEFTELAVIFPVILLKCILLCAKRIFDCYDWSVVIHEMCKLGPLRLRLILTQDLIHFRFADGRTGERKMLRILGE